MSPAFKKPILVTPRQCEVLQIISENPAQSIGEIAPLLSISSAAATKMVDRLEKKGLVRRVVDEWDRRNVRVSITPAGQKTLRHALLSEDGEN